MFDADKTVPCIGLLPRTFWKMPGVVRSVHPTHSVCARGKRAAELTALHGEDITPVGKNSPFMKLPEIGGRLLFIGEVLDCCTFMHGVEERFGTDYVLTKEKIRYVVNGEEKYMYGHDFKGWETTYRRVKEILDPAKRDRHGEDRRRDVLPYRRESAFEARGGETAGESTLVCGAAGVKPNRHKETTRDGEKSVCGSFLAL